ncbi:hypothetical protein NQ317_001110 [Molorchus minor]|uniref:Uncharacterized protein n=1 Tax=Molorchus minor TaxID=1323400 RepID=A0ABQ9JJ97_9CUCU|nr:hypothetical protein NQ317_001110 [Molorchus minor]
MAPMTVVGSMAGIKRCLSQVSMLAFKASTSGEEAWAHTWTRYCPQVNQQLTPSTLFKISAMKKIDLIKVVIGMAKFNALAFKT